MELNHRHIALVQQSLDHILPIAQSTGERFYQHLFAQSPELRPLFKGNMREQARKLMTILIHIIANLDHVGQLQELKELADRHIDYHVEASHYELIGSSLIFTLSEEMGSHWNEELKESWSLAYDKIAQVMIERHRSA